MRPTFPICYQLCIGLKLIAQRHLIFAISYQHLLLINVAHGDRFVQPREWYAYGPTACKHLLLVLHDSMYLLVLNGIVWCYCGN